MWLTYPFHLVIISPISVYYLLQPSLEVFPKPEFSIDIKDKSKLCNENWNFNETNTLFFNFNFAPFSIKIFATFLHPFSAATCKAVLPYCRDKLLDSKLETWLNMKKNTTKTRKNTKYLILNFNHNTLLHPFISMPRFNNNCKTWLESSSAAKWRTR